MNTSKRVGAATVASLIGFISCTATAAPPQVRAAPRPVLANPNRPQADVQQPATEQYTSLAITVASGDDDLRSDSSAWVTVYYPNNSQQKCDLRTSNETWDNNSTHDAPQCVFAVPKSLDELRQSKIMLSYDGEPGAGDGFHTWDNWNVNEVRVEAVNSLQHLQKCLIDASKNPRLVRFTSVQSTYDLSAAASSC